MATILHELYRRGQSVWCDNLSRAMLEPASDARPVDTLAGLMELGVVGVTSNPTILLKAISSGRGYEDRLRKLVEQNADPMNIYEGLVLPDIADAADLLRPVYERTGGVDGFVSLEVSPRLAHDTGATVAEAARLFRLLNRPNVFIKVPATAEGISAIEALIAQGVNVNVTLIFSLSVHDQVMRAYRTGLQRLRDAGSDISRVASVASFFVSRVDTAVDARLEALAAKGRCVDHLFGKSAIANAKLAYARFQSFFDSSAEFASLARRGARVQRPLWASTSTKSPKYPDTLYVDHLVGPRTVNTLPPDTIEAVLDHGSADVCLEDGLDEARAVLAELADLGIDLSAVTAELTRAGVAAFAESFEKLLKTLSQRRNEPRSAVSKN